MSETTEHVEDQMIDPVKGEIINQKKLAEQLLAQARERECPRSARTGCCPVLTFADR